MTHITTVSGNKFDFADPKFNTADIAYALSNIRRYNGHSSQPWTVLQHSLACARLAPAAFKFEALMHDACEAYLCDMPTPLKAILPDYRALEASIELAMRRHYGLPETMSDEVRQVDRDMLFAETSIFHNKLWKEMEHPVPRNIPAAVDAITGVSTQPQHRCVDAFINLVRCYSGK